MRRWADYIPTDISPTDISPIATVARRQFPETTLDRQGPRHQPDKARRGVPKGQVKSGQDANTFPLTQLNLWGKGVSQVRGKGTSQVRGKGTKLGEVVLNVGQANVGRANVGRAIVSPPMRLFHPVITSVVSRNLWLTLLSKIGLFLTLVKHTHKWA